MNSSSGARPVNPLAHQLKAKSMLASCSIICGLRNRYVWFVVIIIGLVTICCLQLFVNFRHQQSKAGIPRINEIMHHRQQRNFEQLAQSSTSNIIGVVDEDTVEKIIIYKRNADAGRRSSIEEEYFRRYNVLLQKKRFFKADQTRKVRFGIPQNNVNHDNNKGISITTSATANMNSHDERKKLDSNIVSTSNSDEEQILSDGLTSFEQDEFLLLRKVLLNIRHKPAPQTQTSHSIVPHHSSTSRKMEQPATTHSKQTASHYPEPKTTASPRFPLPRRPNATDNAAELKRLRLIRESIERNETVLVPTIFRKPLQRDSRYNSKNRRPLAPMPKRMNCTARKPMLKLPDSTRHDETVRPKYAVVSLVVRSSAHNADNTTRRSIMHELTFLNKLQYCKLHGYDFILEDESVIDTSRPPHWSKIRVLRKWLPFYEWIVWVDMDVIFTNWERKIEHLVQDELTRYLLDDLKRQEDIITKYHQAKFVHEAGGQEEIDRVKVQWYWAHRREKGSQPAKAGNTPNGLESLAPQLAPTIPKLNMTSNDTMPSFKMKQIDLILTHDQNGWNSGVMFFRNSWWTHNFLRRVWAVPPVLTKPYFDQGAFKWLLSPNFRGRNYDEAEIDVNHLWDTDDNTFNANHENFIFREYDLVHRWEEGDWMMHLASCKSYPYCVEWLEHLNEIALCNNSHAQDAPLFDRDGVSPFKTPNHYFPLDLEMLAKATLPPTSEDLWDVSGIPMGVRGEYFSAAPPPPPTPMLLAGAYPHQRPQFARPNDRNRISPLPGILKGDQSTKDVAQTDEARISEKERHDLNFGKKKRRFLEWMGQP